MLLDRLGPPGRCRGCRPHDGEVAGGAVADLVLLISGPRVNLNYHPLRARGVEWASVSADLRGSLATRGVAPKQHRGLRRAFSPAFRAGSLYPLARGCRRIWRGEGWLRRVDAARPARAAWAGPRLQAARCRGRRRRRRRLRTREYPGPRQTPTVT